VVTALASAFLLFFSGYIYGSWGLLWISTIAIALGIAEYSRIAFSRFDVSRSFMWLFAITCIVLYSTLVHWPHHGLLIFAVCTSLFLCTSLWITRNSLANEKLLPALGMGSLGMLYCVTLPVFAIWLLFLHNGPMWFWFLLLVVFAGDTFAFFGGRFFGNKKLMPEISPNKTVEGSIAGLIGSALTGIIFVTLVFPETPVLRVTLFCLACGFVGQAGDLLMSLVKRVAQVKDSGSIMPGHGGILDRLDGIFLSAPLVYAFAIS
jgi:phosphatidate cytidylyltransferase